MNKLELDNCLKILNEFESKHSELSIWKHSVDLGKMFKPELFVGDESGSTSNHLKIFENNTAILSFSYDKVGLKDDISYYVQLHINDMVIHNIDFDLFKYLIKQKINNYFLKQIKNG